MNSISSIPTIGFGIGGLINRRISENFDIRLRPIFIFSDRLIRYEYEVNSTAGQNYKSENFERIIDKKLQATMIELPMSIKMKSDRLNNVRTYFEGGIKYSVDLASKKKTFDEGEMPINKLLKNKRKYFSYEAAVGLDFYFEYFKA